MAYFPSPFSLILIVAGRYTLVIRTKLYLGGLPPVGHTCLTKYLGLYRPGPGPNRSWGGYNPVKPNGILIHLHLMECIMGRYILVHWTELYLGGIHPVDPKDVSFVSNKVFRVVSPRFCQIDHWGDTPVGPKGHVFCFQRSINCCSSEGQAD